LSDVTNSRKLSVVQIVFIGMRTVLSNSTPIRLAVILFAALILSSCSAESPDVGEALEPNLGASESYSDATVELFEPGVVNSSWPEFSVAFTTSGDTLYFNRSNVNRSSLAIMMSVRLNGEWQTPAVAPFSGEFYDIMPSVSTDGSVFFSSRRVNPETRAESFDNFVFVGDGNTIRLPGSLNSDSTEVSVSSTLDGSIVFESNRGGVNRIWMSRVEDGARQFAEPLPIPGVLASGNPFISQDGLTLLFVSTPSGDADLYYSCLVDGGWTIATRFAGPINSSEDDYAPGADPEGYIYFASQRPGMVDQSDDSEKTPPSDIYKSSVRIQTLCSAGR